jgi:hypothetical protein
MDLSGKTGLVLEMLKKLYIFEDIKILFTMK